MEQLSRTHSDGISYLLSCGRDWGKYADPGIVSRNALSPPEERRSELFNYYEVIELSHLNIPNPWNPCYIANRAVQVTEEYFFGNWRQFYKVPFVYEDLVDDKLTSYDKSLRALDATDPIRWGLFFTTLTHASDLRCKIADFTLQDVCLNGGTWELSDQDMSFLKVLCEYLRVGEIDETSLFATECGATKRKRARLAYKCLNAICKKSAEEFNRCFKDYMKQYLSREYNPELRPHTSCEGAILFMLAQERGLPVSVAVEKHRQHLIVNVPNAVPACFSN